MEIGSSSWKNAIRSGAGDFGITVPEDALDRFAVHARELIRWNRIVNLTAITDPLQLAIKHYLDAIVPATVIPRHSNLLDIGSGGGFPGIPLKILYPTLSVTLVDTVRKKVNFLKHVIRTLELDNLAAFHNRAEDLYRDTVAGAAGLNDFGKKRQTAETGEPGKRAAGPFDVVISRALTSLDGFFKMALPLMAEKGMVIAMKGRMTDSELGGARKMLPEHLHTTGFSEADCELEVVRYQLPSLKAERTLAILRAGG